MGELGAFKTTPRADDKPEAQVVLPLVEKGKTTARYLLGPVQGTGKIIRTASAQVDPSNGRWLVTFETTGKGSAAWVTGRSPGRGARAASRRRGRRGRRQCRGARR